VEKTAVFTGKTLELAIENALTQLGLSRDDVSVQVLAQAKPGFLGIGAQDAKIEVTYEAPDPKPRSALGSASRSKPKAKPAPKATVGQGLAPAEPKAEEAPAPKAEKAPKATVGQGLAPAVEKTPKAPKAPKVFTPAEKGSVEEKIEVFLKGLLEQMGSDAVPHCQKTDDTTYDVELTGSDLGYLIGRRGDTLDALQHLANYSINRNTEGRIRINVDAEDYRAKREDSLCRYARKKAQQVLKARRRTTLEPMNAYERHVIHSTLQDMDRITTYSVGTEPNRRVVIEYVR